MSNSTNLKKHISLTSSHDIAQICRPLMDFLGISNFSLRRIYADGSRFYLCTNPSWVEHYFNMNYWKMGKFDRLINTHKLNYILWDHWPKEDHIFLKLLKDARENFDQAHGLSFVKDYQDYIDVYSFATAKDNEGINNLYLGNLIPLEKFTDYFIVNASEILNKAAKNKLHPSRDETNLLSKNTYCVENHLKISKFYNDIRISVLPFKLGQDRIFLSKREIECFLNIMEGKTAKQTARILNLSPRTVEFYLENLKHKTRCRTRAELVRKVLSINLINPFLFER